MSVSTSSIPLSSISGKNGGTPSKAGGGKRAATPKSDKRKRKLLLSPRSKSRNSGREKTQLLEAKLSVLSSEFGDYVATLEAELANVKRQWRAEADGARALEQRCAALEAANARLAVANAGLEAEMANMVKPPAAADAEPPADDPAEQKAIDEVFQDVIRGYI